MPSPSLKVMLACSGLLLLTGTAHGQDASAASGASATLAASEPESAMTLGVEADFGVAGRLGASESGYRDDEKAGALVGGGLFFSPMPLFDVGLTYQRTQLGTEIAPPSESLVANSLFRSLNSVWGNVRTYPFRGEKVRLFVGLMFGPTWETSRGHVTYSPSGMGGAMRSYSGSASGPAALALGVTTGADFDLGSGLALLTRLSFASYHVSSDPLTDPDGRILGPGAGSAATLDARLGFAYRFDLGGRAPAPSLASN